MLQVVHDAAGADLSGADKGTSATACILRPTLKLREPCNRLKFYFGVPINNGMNRSLFPQSQEIWAIEEHWSFCEHAFNQNFNCKIRSGLQ
jgi:hypothetical protein